LFTTTLHCGQCRSVERFEKLNRLGEGSYGTVYRAKDLDTGEIVALKKVAIHSEADGFPQSSLREIRLLKALCHPHIVELREVVCGQQKPGTTFLVFEYCEHDVAALLLHMDRPLSQAEVKCLMLQLLRAVAYFHGRFIIHRDLKVSNLLLTNKGMLKLADFGLAREFSDPPDCYTTNVVTLWYRAPELLLGATLYSSAIDMWSGGCIFGELLLHKPLLPGKSEEHQLQLICELLGTPNEKIWPEVVTLPLHRRWVPPAGCEYNNLAVRFPDATDGCLDLMNRLLTFNPTRRITATSCLQHSYFDEMPAPQQPQWMPTWREHRNDTKHDTLPPEVRGSFEGVARTAGGSTGSSMQATGTDRRTRKLLQSQNTSSALAAAVSKRLKSAIF